MYWELFVQCKFLYILYQDLGVFYMRESCMNLDLVHNLQ